MRAPNEKDKDKIKKRVLELLKLVDLPNSSITINSHRGKIDTMIKYNFGDGLEKLNLSVKNYSSFSGLTLVDGTPLDTIIKYIN